MILRHLLSPLGAGAIAACLHVLTAPAAPAETPPTSASAPPTSAARLPPLAGEYRRSTGHPRVFTTEAELESLATRINRPGSYSRTRFDALAALIGRDLASRTDWDEAYAGCRQKTYLFAFSYEPQETSFLPVLRADLKTPAGRDPPAGAAVVASRLALYAALVTAGAVPPHGAPGAQAPSALARRILLAWADRGFRNAQGRLRSLASFDCGDDGRPYDKPDAQTGLALGLGRGAIYSTDAQDLLLSLGALDAAQAARLDALHRALFDLIRQSSNKFDANPHFTCERYANGQANAVAALLAIARLLDDSARFDAAVHGGDPGGGATLHVSVPWDLLFDQALVGYGEQPGACYPNRGADGPTSPMSYVTAEVQRGEINDRYRNANPAQSIGYAMFTLERFVDSAELLRLAGYDPYVYRGRHGQSIELSIHYYACFGEHPGFGNIVDARAASACPNGTQYLGKIVNGVAPLVTFGADRFAGDAQITRIEEAAKKASSGGPFAADAVLFGRWRD